MAVIIHAITPENNERFERRDVYEISLHDAIKYTDGTLREIEEMVRSGQ
ncbi:TPA: hypothetical protein KNG91_002081 [Serratia fonticola]|nr:hypothetical protein [Serratia fonticola]HBE9093422.1 hypothetical protein [Serratia fonticola]HBE9152364.1 hypothetical protein [Serratia fonticola]